MHVKVTNGKVDQYPYTIGQFRRDNPNISFPKSIPDDVLVEYGVYEVQVGAQPSFDPSTQKLTLSNTPSLIQGAWVIEHYVEQLSADEMQKVASEAAQKVRAKRDRLLAESDWVVVMHTEKGTNIPAEWEIYRQALRDITDHVNFPHLQEGDWPVKP